MAVFIFGRGTPNKVNPVFSENSWEQIIKACQMNKVPDSWEVGNYKNMTIGDQEYLIAIIGKKHDTYSDGTGMAPLTLNLVDCYKTGYRIHSGDRNTIGWANCEMRTTTLPTLMALMPTEVQSGIREVNKKTTIGGGEATINITADKLFLLARDEVFATGGTSTTAGEGSLYPYYSDTNRRIKKRASAAGAWWLRSPSPNNITSYYWVNGSGSENAAYPSGSYGVSFAFCF